MNMIFRKRMIGVLVAAFAVICTIGFTTHLDASVYAETGDAASAINIGSDVLKTDVNTDNAQIAWYGGLQWYPISYDGHGNKYTAKDGQMTLFSKSEMADIPYNSSDDNTYFNSGLQQYLYDWFNTFYKQEQEAVAYRTLEGGCPNKPESSNDFIGYDPNRVKGPPVVSTIWPLTVAMANELPQKIRGLERSGSMWWLCSPGIYDDYAAYVGYDGYVVDTGAPVENPSHLIPFCPRPAIDLDKSKVVLTSAAVGGKKSGDLGFDALTPVEANKTNEWKLTVEDSKRNDFAVSEVKWFTFPCGEATTLYMAYHGAVSGDNNYISGIIVNAEGRVTYYGRLDKASRANDFLVYLKGKFNEGDTLYIFNEQVNEDNQTDWSSGLRKIDIPEKPDPVDYDPENVIWVDFGKENQKSYLTVSPDEEVVFGYKEEKGRMLYFNMWTNKLAKKTLVDQDGKIYATRDNNVGDLKTRVWAPKGSTFYMYISPGVKHADCSAYVDVYDNSDPVVIKGKTVKINAKGNKLKKNVAISAKKAYDIQGNVDKPAFAKIKANKSNRKFTVNAKTGKITVKKGLKKGKYRLKVKVHIPGSVDHDPYDETTTVTIIVK